MPTPSSDSLPIPVPASPELSRPTCPPQEESQRIARLADQDPSVQSENVEVDLATGSNTTTDTPATTGPTTAAVAADDGNSTTTSKSAEADADTVPRDASSPLSMADSVDCEQRLSQSVSLASETAGSLQWDSTSNCWLGNPFPKSRYLPNTSSSFLRPGSRFSGTQRSEKQEYEVQVELQHVDIAESFLCGYLRIQGLTDHPPTLTTYFEGEMIGSKYTFITNHADWGSTEKVDMQHWARFPAWRPLTNHAKRQSFIKNFAQKENIFMRWKEQFLVPDHRVDNIAGASFEGFYYICFNQVTGVITGIYFHSKSERYQHLDLKHVEDGGCMSAFEFR